MEKDLRLRQRKSPPGRGSSGVRAVESSSNSSVVPPRAAQARPLRSLLLSWRGSVGMSTLVAAQIVCVSCALWILLYLLVGGTGTAKDLYASLLPIHDKAGVPLVALVLPTLIAATFASLWSIRRPEAPFVPNQTPPSARWTRGRMGHVLRRYCLPGGDPDFRQWGILVMVVPCLIFATFSVYRKAISATTQAGAVAESGNAFGITALVALSLLLIPVTRHGSLLPLWGWNPAAAIRLHICAGRSVMAMVFLHGACHVWHWMLLEEHVLSLFVVPVQCLTKQSFQPKCLSKLTDCSCYAHARNLTGLLGALALLVIGVSTLNVVRRRLYSWFYKIHMLAGPTVLLCTMLHWNRSIMYLAGALLYYVACSCPTWIERIRANRSGVHVLSVERMETDTPGHRPCVAVTFAASDVALGRYRAGQYLKLSCPSASSLWHPFTVNLVPNQARQLRLIVRCTGPFTSQLATQLTRVVNEHRHQDGATGPPVPIHLDGFFGCPFRVEQVLQHDVVVFVAGGVGITPYLSLIHKIHALSLQRRLPTRRVVLHWTCRDAALVAFVQREYIDAWISADAETDETKSLQLSILIHKTGRPRPSTRDGGRASTYTDLENPQDCEVEGRAKDALASVPCTVPSEHQANCVPFTPSRYAPGSKNSIRGNAASFISFTLTVWIGLVGVWYFYRNKATKLSMLPRLYAPLFVLAWGMVVALAVHWLFADSILARYWGVHEDADDPVSSSWEPIQTNDIGNGGRLARSASSELGELELSASVPDSNTDAVGDRREDVPRVQVEHKEGRPTVYQFLNSLDGSRTPGLFACGPVSLLNDVRRATNERCLLRYRQCIRGEPNIALYEEAFEM